MSVVYAAMLLDNGKLVYHEFFERPSEMNLLLALYGNSYRTDWRAPQSDAGKGWTR
jgi:hypothetical protein